MSRPAVVHKSGDAAESARRVLRTDQFSGPRVQLDISPLHVGSPIRVLVREQIQIKSNSRHQLPHHVRRILDIRVRSGTQYVLRR